MEEPANTIIELMTVQRHELLRAMPWWRRLWHRVWGVSYSQWQREFDAAVRSAPRRPPPPGPGR